MKHEDLLDSWKEISLYLERDIRTCIRWEKDLGLPVHRIDESSSRAKVFAYKSEIDAWHQNRAGVTKTRQKSFLDNKKNTAIIMAASIFFSLCLITLYIHNIKTSSNSSLAIAFLPLENQNSNEYNQLLTAGIMNDLASRIMDSGKFLVIPLTRRLEHRSSSQKDKNIYKKSGADYILMGGARVESSTFNINVDLIRAKDGKNVFKENYQQNIERFGSIQQDIFQKICENLNLSPDISRIYKPPIHITFDIYSQKQHYLSSIKQESNEVWQLCFQGEKCFETLTKESNSQAFDLFQKALDMDKNCAYAYLGMAHVYINYFNFNEKKNAGWLDKAKDFVEKAQSAEPDLPEYFCTLIEIYLLQEEFLFVDKKDLIRELAEKGLQKYPRHIQLNSIIGQYYSSCFGENGDSADFTRALEMKKRAFLLNPFSKNNLDYTELLMLQKNHLKALKICQLIARSDISDEILPRLMQIYYYMEDFAACKTTYTKIQKASLALKLDLQFFLGMMAVQEGNQRQAEDLIKKINIMCQDGIIKDFNLKMASIYLGLNMKEKGFQYLDAFFKKPFVHLKHYIYLNYIDIDKNFDTYKEEIFNKYKNRTAN